MDQNNGINAMPEPADAGTAKTGGRFNSAFTQPLFLAICVLLTIATALSAFSVSINAENGSFNIGMSFNIILLLPTIGAWIIYGKAKNGASPIVGMKLVSGVVKANYILKYVAFGFIIFYVWTLSVGISFFSYTLQSEADSLMWRIYSAMATYDSLIAHFIVAFFVTAFVAGGIVINAVFYRKVHKFTKSMCLVEEGKAENAECTGLARGWYKVVGVITAVVYGIFCIRSVLVGVMYTVGSASTQSTITIIASVLAIFNSVCTSVAGVLIAAVYICLSKWIKNNADILT
ncbi:MAG: hypothetical protein IKP68_06410 [Clostridia bacterium]|nr:hypothetical protein [Clostridia bacterium]